MSTLFGVVGRHALVAIVVFALAGAPETRAEVRMPKVFGAHMVLQQGKPLPVWGWAQPREKITVRLAGESQETQANDQGEWKVVLPAMKAGGPFVMTVSGGGTITFEDVMIGEVWLCSGQSNMEMGIDQAADGAAEIAAANHPSLRLLLVPKRQAPLPEADMEGAWKVCTPQSVPGFSACAYYFGRGLHQGLGVAVGLISASWGGTPIDTWTPPVGFAAVPALQKESERVQLADPRSPLHKLRAGETCQAVEQWLTAVREAVAAEKPLPALPEIPAELLGPRNEQNPTVLFNGMICPLSPFAVRGAIWYQGENNMGEGMLYAEKMKALVGGWRQIWGDAGFPFYFVQIAPFNYPGRYPQTEAELWEAQATAAKAIPQTGMVVINDIGNLKDIHPANKQEVGRRLSLWALARTYGRTNLVCAGPTFKTMCVEGATMRLSFENVGGGLASRDGKPLSWFDLLDREGGRYVPADARIEGASIVLSSPNIRHPVGMRFAWSMVAEPNLINVEGLPAGAFRAGAIPIYISSLDLSQVFQAYGTPQADKSVGGTPIAIAGQSYLRGLGTHAESRFRLALRGKGQRFTAKVGVDDETKNRGSVVFRVVGDGKTLWESGKLAGGDKAVECSVDLMGVEELLLAVSDAGDGMDSDHADWAEAQIVMSEGKPEAIAAVQ